MNGFSRHITFIAIVLCGILIAPLTPHAQGAQHGQNIPTDPVVACRKGAELIYMGDLATALDYLEYGFAARATGQFDDVNDLATCAFMLALVREQFVDWEGAIEAYQLAGEIYMETDDAIGMFTVVKGIGFASQQLGNYQDALTYNNIAVQFAEILTEAGIFDDASELVNLWVRIGNVEQSRGLHQQALIAYQAAQELLPMIDDEVLKIDVLINLGEIQRTIGLYADAQTSLEDARTKARRAHDRFYEAVAYAALGSMYEDQGDLGVATEHYMLALHVAEDSEISALEATIRNNLGLVFYAQGRYTDAGEQYELALEAAAADEMLMQSDPSFTEQIKLNKSMVLRQKHTNRAYLDALTLLKEILTVAQDMGKQQLESNVFNQMALVHYDMGDLEQALLLLRESAAILEQLNDPLNQARTRENIAELTYELGDSDAALALLLDVLETFEELGAQEEIGAVLATIGIIYTEDGDNDRGLEFIMDAIDVLDTVRARAGSLEGRSWFSGQYANVYRVAVRLLHEQGRDEDALAVSERGKARAFNDMMSTSTIRLSDTDAQELLDNEGAAFRQMRLTEDELRQKRANPEPEKSSIQLLETQLEEDRATHAATVKQLDAYLDATGRLDPEDMAVASLEEIKAALDGSSTLIAYHIVSDVETVAFVITKNDVVGVTLPMGQTELSRNIATFRRV